MDSSYYQRGECFVAIKRSRSGSINSFRQYHRAKVASFIIVSQIATTIGIGGVLLLTGITDYLSPYFWLTIVLLFCFGISTLIVLLPIVTAPIDDVLAALAHKIGEPTKLVPLIQTPRTTEKPASRIFFKQFMRILPPKISLPLKKTRMIPPHALPS